MYAGKAAAELWLYEDLQEWPHIVRKVGLALKYYCKSEGRLFESLEDVKGLAANRFEAIVTWCGSRARSPKKTNLGVAFLVLHLWSEAITCLYNSDNLCYDELLWLGEACMKSKDFDGAINLFRRAIDTTFTEFAEVALANAYKAKGDLANAINVLRDAFTKFLSYDSSIPSEGRIPTRLFLTVMNLAELYATTGDHEGRLRSYKLASQRKWWTHQCLEEAFLSVGNTASAKAMCQNLTKEWGTAISSEEDSRSHEKEYVEMGTTTAV
jgi:tetratricopeptide (TPR) repeat protein